MMHLLVVEYDVHELESEQHLYVNPNNSDLCITVVEKTREECLEAIKQKVLEIFGSFCLLNITTYIVDKELTSETFTIAHCNYGINYA